MKKAPSYVSIVLALCVATVAQDSSYYKAIEKGAATPVQPNQFKQMEQDALKDYSRAENYEGLATAFGGSTEKVWAVIYGEVFANLSSDADRRNAIGSLVYESYEKSLSSDGGKLSVNLTENAQAAPGQSPFESQFEIAFLMAAAPFGNDLMPLSVQKLAQIRKNQLSLLNQKKLSSNELIRWQQTIIAAGHFDAYNYWLFQGARPDEFNQWTKEHQAQYQAWLDWRAKNKFVVQTPDFQRLYLMRGRH
jgi:hypothetical protein